MAFKVAARTILQLGAELISSDQIAFYELIKNAIDARSKSVEVEIVSRLPYEVITEQRARLLEEKKRARESPGELLIELSIKAISAINPSAPQVRELEQAFTAAKTIDDLLGALEGANYINILDTGRGMSLEDLNEVYLTIGTPLRLKQRQNSRHAANKADDDSERPLLGEKGVGRLSVMRLGRRLRVRTSKSGEPRWNELLIDWSRFAEDPDDLLKDIRVEPKQGDAKQSKVESGTLIHISGLTSEWNAARVKQIVEGEFSRFADPFNPKAKYPIDVYFNDEPFRIPDFDQSIFKHAHATVEAEFNVPVDGREDANESNLAALRLKGRINYRLRDVQKKFDLCGAELKSPAKVASLQTLRLLGPFKMKAYWFNRRLLNAASGIPNFQHVKNVVNEWAGGLMLYRDGFRVHPYGGPDDDWLDLDHKALSSSGYKVNRRQLIGKVDISSRYNERLTDQTNREGLRESDEKRALIMLLKHILETEMRVFLNNVEKRITRESAQVGLDVLEKRVDEEVRSALQNVRELVNKLPAEERQSAAVSNIGAAFERIQQSIRDAKGIAESYKEGLEQTVHLAGIGLMVEMLAHELNRTAANALATLAETRAENLPDAVKAHFKTLESQMKTLQKRLQVLDPLGTAARHRKETFDLVSWVKEILSGHEGQFRRYHIKASVKVLPDAAATLRVKVVRGMIVQVLENLITNSVYWLKQQREVDKTFAPRIEVVVDTAGKEITVTDNGPGVDPTRREEIFLPFVTLKPSGEGKGLGLYIAREIATYHDAELYLSEVPTVHAVRLNTFVFSLGNKEQ